MRLIAVKDITFEVVLGKSIYGFNNKLMLGAGYRLTPAVKSRLVEKGISNIYIMEEGTEDVIPEDVISEEVRLQARNAISEKSEQIEKMFKFQDFSRSKVQQLLEDGYMKTVHVTYDMKKIVDEILKDISSAGVKFMNSLMFKSNDSYLMDHSINVTTLGVLVGQRYRFSRPELTDLALGCMLHDFGKIILEKMKDSSQSITESEMYREHPTFGYLMVSNSHDASPVVSQVVNQHHENQDGSGFPIGLKGQNLPPISMIKRETKGNIFRLAEICSVVNAYDNLLLNPSSEEQLTPAEAMMQILRDAGTKYNKDVVQVLTKVVPHFPVGAYITVVNLVDPSLIGYGGVVAKMNEEYLNRPTIILLYDRAGKKIKPKIIDTSKLKIVDLQLVV